MPVTTSTRTPRRPLRARGALTLALAALLLSACSGGGPAPAAPVPPSAGDTTSPSTPPPDAPSPEEPSEADVPAGWSRYEIDGLSLAVPPGLVQTQRKSDLGDEFVAYDDGASGGDAFVIVYVRNGAQLPFEVIDEAQTAKANNTLDQQPTTGPDPLPVPGTSKGSLTTWLWTGGTGEIPRSTTYVYLSGRPGPRYLVHVGGSQESWPQERVDTLVGSLSVAGGPA